MTFFVRHLIDLDNTRLQVQNSSFRLQDIPRHPDTALSELWEAFRRTLLLLGFQAYIRAHIAIFSTSAAPPRPSRWGLPWLSRGLFCAPAPRVAVRATDAGPLIINALMYTCTSVSTLLT